MAAVRTQQQLKAGEAVTRAFQAELEGLKIDQAKRQKEIETDLSEQQNKLELLSSQITDPAERQRAIQPFVDRIKELQLEAAELPGKFAITAAERTVAAAKAGKIQGVTAETAGQGLAEIKEIAKLSSDKAKTDLEGAAALKKQRDDIDVINYRAQKAADAAEMRYKFDEQTERSLQQQLTASEELLEVKNNMGLLTADEYLVAKNLNQLQAIDRQYNQDLLGLNKQRADALADINRQLAIAIRIGDLQEQQRLGVKIQDLEEYYGAEFALLERSNQAKLEATRLGQYQDSRTEKYAQAFKNAFKSMEDAIVEFTKTGKLSFKSMINSFIEELLRYEIQQQQAFFIKGLGGISGIARMFMGSLGIGGPANLSGGFFASDIIQTAKGGAFDGKGMTSYAHGGTFTNSVVSQPTMFSFASGGSFGGTRLGQMGEAGPEAVMPLVRNRNGDLAVHTVDRQSNVEVVVNNYTQAKAEAKESVDSRGNRRVEVTIADMVSGEMSRNGSNIQTAFATSFGAKPLVARR
jgi:lambda family phage tail tape measure protein